MKKSANLKRQVFDKDKFRETVDTEFSQLIDQPDPAFFSLDLATIKDFWLLYDRFFFDIPKLGEVESHEYLAKTSGEYSEAERTNAEIQALLEEITTLREENLELRQEEALKVIERITNDTK